MICIVYDGSCVARAQISQEVLREFLRADGVCFEEQSSVLAKREGVVVCYKNKVRVKRLSGHWYQISGYREDGADLDTAIFSLRNAERVLANRAASKSRGFTLAALAALA